MTKISTITRRTAIALAAGTAVNALAIATTKADGTNVSSTEDAELLALGDKLKIAQQAVDAVSARHSADNERYQERRPPFPEVCRPRPSDDQAIGLRDRDRTPDGEVLFYTVDRLRQLGPTRTEMRVEEVAGGSLLSKVEVPNDLDRVREFVQAYDEWLARHKALSDEYGMGAWDEEIGEACDACCTLQRLISSTPAHTLDGMKVKAWAALCYEGNLQENLEGPELGPDDCMGAEDLLNSLARNILRMT